MTRPVPATVRTRQRWTYLADALLGLALLTCATPRSWQFTSYMAFCVAVLGAGLAIAALRRSINSIDLATADLDEYQLQQRVAARDDAFRSVMTSLLAIFILIGGLALYNRFDTALDTTWTLLLLSKLILLVMLWSSFAITRSLAGKLNRDELITNPDF